jgi:hypothetical protein
MTNTTPSDPVGMFEAAVEAIRMVRPAFLRSARKHAPFAALHALPEACPSCGQASLVCCFSGALGDGGSTTEEYLHVCLRCRHHQFETTWYTDSGADWADCSCVICHFRYGDPSPRDGEIRPVPDADGE